MILTKGYFYFILQFTVQKSQKTLNHTSNFKWTILGCTTIAFSKQYTVYKKNVILLQHVDVLL
jgi:hypothetical protein